MTAIAAERPKERDAGKRKGLLAFLYSPTFATALLGAIVTVAGYFIGPTLAAKSQNHEKRLEVKTTLATDMSKSFAMAVGAGQRVASGLIYGPTGDRHKNAAVVQGAYNAGLGQWQVDGGRISAELVARYKKDPIVGEWRRYRLAVTRFYHLSALVPGDERRSYVRGVRLYLERMRGIPWAAASVPGQRTFVNWNVLKQVTGFKKSRAYRRTYNQVSAAFLSLGDAFVQETLSLRPEV